MVLVFELDWDAVMGTKAVCTVYMCPGGVMVRTSRTCDLDLKRLTLGHHNDLTW